MSFYPSRRDFLHVGFVGGIGLSLTDYLRLKANADIKNYETTEGPAKSVVFIYLPGGMAHQESFDPKPYAPIEYRGPMSHIQTKIPGEFFNQNMVQTAQIADKIAVCRSMTHGEAAHERGTHNMFTGYRPSPALQFPSMGSVVSHEFGPRTSLPPYVAIPNQPNEFAGTGYLSSSYAPFSVGSDPASGNFTVRDLNLPGGVDDNRFSRRRNILDAVNDHFVSKEKADSIDAVDTFYQRAYGMVSSQEAREAFNINAEPDAIRDEYGRNTAGARMLLARRLVEAGSRFITLTYGGWDMHDNIHASMNNQMPAFDQGFAALIRDLDRRSLLASTLVCVCSEFGRTPKINNTSGRDHWPKVFSVILAGGGTKPGIVYGKSDATGSEPEVDALTVEDWATTIYNQLGIVADKELMAPGDRPIEIVDGGKVRQELLA
ncbi:MAG TPA: DUF1501 domain-containing protein [Planctomycetaceae bacterium]|nr:DUF1501 domain-containing protein [Planctomycetaceae bacterium]